MRQSELGAQVSMLQFMALPKFGAPGPLMQPPGLQVRPSGRGLTSAAHRLGMGPVGSPWVCVQML